MNNQVKLGLLESNDTGANYSQASIEDMARQMVAAGYSPLTDGAKAIGGMQRKGIPRTVIDQALEIAGRMHSEIRRER